MGGYLVNFSVYTMAMIGLIFFAMMIYKKFSCDGIMTKKSDFLSVEEAISIAPRKKLYVVRAGQERFLIAGDVDKTTLISKLDCNSSRNQKREQMLPTREFSDMQVKSVDDLPDIMTRGGHNSRSNVLHSMVRKINQ